VTSTRARLLLVWGALFVAAMGGIGAHGVMRGPDRVAAPTAETLAAPAVTPLLAAAALHGRLLGPDDAPLAGHVVAWRESEPNGPRVETDCAPDGTFALADLAGDRWVIAATAPGYSEARAVRAASPDTLELRVVRTARVAGTVLGVDGAPSAAEVVIVGSAIWPARTVPADAAGAFAFENVPPGIYEVEARGVLASSEPRRGLVVEDGARVVLTLSLSPGRTLRGHVIDDVSGAAIANAEIVVAESALSSTPRIAHSDASGAFEVTGLRSGTDAIVSARADGRVALVAEPWRGSDLMLRMRRTGTVEGRVVDADHRPIAGAQIEVWGETNDGQPIAVSEGNAALTGRMDGAPADPSRLEVTADVPPIPLAALATLPPEMPQVHLASYRTEADGTFHLDDVAPGEIEVLARHAGYGTASSERVRVTGGETTSGVEVVLAPAGALAGVVVDERGDGVADVRIEARSERDPWPTIAFTDAYGAFAIAATGDTVVRAVPIDRAPAELRLALASGEHRSATLSLDPAGLALHGRVLDERGFPIEGAQLRIEALRPGTAILRTAFSTADGSFDLGSVPTPPLRVTVDQNGYAMGTSVDVTDLNGTDIHLERALHASGSVTDAWSGEPIVGARVVIVSESLPPLMRDAIVDREGTFSFPRLRAGTYAMRVEAPGYVAFEHTLVAASSRSGEVDVEPITLDAGQRLEGDVVDRLGSVAEGALVSIDGVATTHTDANGHFVLEAVPAGDAHVHVAHESAGTIDLARHVVRGRDDVAIIAHLPGRLDAAPTVIAHARTRGVPVVLGAGGAIATVARGSSAERAGLRAGDAIVAIDGEAGTARMGGSGPALLTVARGGQRFVVRVDRELHD
jgi:protocatechuate 3,4-dioxygenase beta subunit